jgi:hypothetical protein
MISSLFVEGQDNIETRFKNAISSIRYHNIYNRIIWDFNPLNEYLVDQDNGTIRYQTDNPEVYAIAEIEILGTFNLDNKTFLWSDKNQSIQNQLCEKVKEFRNGLPTSYQTNKFKSDTEFNEKLLALFNYTFQSNGYDIVRQGNTIIYIALMKINVYKNDKISFSIGKEPHFEIIDSDILIKTVKQFHKEKLLVNDKFYNKKELTDSEAFQKITEVHLKYWKNEDEYYYPSLCWPCDYAETSAIDWKVIRLINTNRIFVIYTRDLKTRFEHYAYEIDKEILGIKILIGRF